MEKTITKFGDIEKKKSYQHKGPIMNGLLCMTYYV